MSNTLIAIAAQYRADCERLADMDLDPQTLADTIDGMGGELETKAQNVAHVIRSIEADAAACAAWAKQAAEREKALMNRANHLRNNLAGVLTNLGIQRVDGPGVSITFRKSYAVEIEDATQLPAEFLRQKPAPAPEPDKPAIAAALKLGTPIPGARLDRRTTLQIK